MLFSAQGMAPVEIYHLLTQVIIPRPVAWVLTANDAAGESLNLAPFSFFNVVCSDPPVLMLSIGTKTDGSLKDSCRNLLAHGDCVIHVGCESQAQAIADTARELPHGESELALIAQQLQPFEGVRLGRLDGAPVALACRLHRHLEVGNRPQHLLLVEVEQVWLDDRICRRDGKGRLRVDAALMRPLARLGGAEYAGLGERFRIERG